MTFRFSEIQAFGVQSVRATVEGSGYEAWGLGFGALSLEFQEFSDCWPS